MIYPENFESKIGFDKIRQLLAAKCLSNLGEERVESMAFSSDDIFIIESLSQTDEFIRIIREEDDFPTNHFLDVRQSLAGIKVEGTWIDESNLFDLRRSLQTIKEIVSFLKKEEEENTPYPYLYKLAGEVTVFPQLISRIDNILDKFGRIKDNASAELSKAYGMGKTVFTLGGESMWNKYHMLISDILNNCQLHTMDAYFKLAISPCSIFSIEEKSSLYYSIQQNYTNPALSSKGLKSFKHELRLFFMPGNWRFEWTNELYHGNDRSVNTAYFSDASCGYKNKSFDINLMLDNIFGTKEYDRYVVTGEYMQQTINRLRPREILVKVGFYL